MPPTDPTATVRLADCPVGAVVQTMNGPALHLGGRRIRYPDATDSHTYRVNNDKEAILIAPSLAALVARAEAGERLADEASNLECRASTLLLSTAPGRITSDPRGVEGEILEDRSELGKALGSFRAALAAYRKANA